MVLYSVTYTEQQAMREDVASLNADHVLEINQQRSGTDNSVQLHGHTYRAYLVLLFQWPFCSCNSHEIDMVETFQWAYERAEL